MTEKPFVAPEEGDLNTDAIQRGLSPEEKKYLKKDLETIESGRGSSDTLADLGEVPSQESITQRYHDDDRQREEERFQHDLDGFEKFIREKGISEEETSYADLNHFLECGTAGKSFVSQAELDKYIKRLEDLEREWHESK